VLTSLDYLPSWEEIRPVLNFRKYRWPVKLIQAVLYDGVQVRQILARVSLDLYI
jgi:hypothetical protein